MDTGRLGDSGALDFLNSILRTWTIGKEII